MAMNNILSFTRSEHGPKVWHHWKGMSTAGKLARALPKALLHTGILTLTIQIWSGRVLPIHIPTDYVSLSMSPAIDAPPDSVPSDLNFGVYR